MTATLVGAVVAMFTTVEVDLRSSATFRSCRRCAT